MSQTGYTPIQIYSSSTASNVPLATNLLNNSLGAELAINITDGKLFYKDNSGTVQVIATKDGAIGTVSSVAMTVPSFLSISGSPITTSGTLAVTLSGTALPTANGGTGLTAFTANQVFYASSSSVVAQSANLTFDGTTLTASALVGPHNGSVGATTPNSGAFTTLSASSTVSGAGFSTYLASPPAIGGTASAAGSFTNLSYTGTLTGSTGILNIGSGQIYKDASGNLGVGTTAPSTQIEASSLGSASISASRTGSSTSKIIISAGASTGIVQATDNAGGAVPLAFYIGTSEFARISGNGGFSVGTVANPGIGAIYATGNITAFYTSDRRFKENIKDVNGALDKVCAIGSKTYDWTDEYIASKGGEDGYFVTKSDFGVIAQDVQEVFPQAVRTREDGTLAVDYERLSTLAFGAIQELLKRVEALEAK